MSKILKVDKPSDYSSWVGHKDWHELISVINYSKLSPVPLRELQVILPLNTAKAD